MSGDHRRPRYHFTPARNWMNDPNGLVHHEGTYHLFFQHNPEGNDWGNMSWGHATSTDLVGWAEQPVALTCTEDEQVFSGSVVVDHHNTSGLGDGLAPPFVAVYTSVYGDRRQAQSLAFSLDLGRTWRRHPGNPVLDRGSREFRDPKVFRHADPDGRERWVMLAVEAVDRQVLFFSSDDLQGWTLESVVGPLGPEGVVWECPDLLALDVDGDPGRLAWVLLVSTNTPDLSAPSSTAYLLGDFDGHVFTPREPVDWRVLDHGTDFYAAVSFSNLPAAEPLVLGWAGNWQYAALTPTSPWRGVMSLPRQLTLRTRDGEPTLMQEVPAYSLARLTEGESFHHGPAHLTESLTLRAGRHYVLEIEWDIADASLVGTDLLAGPDTRTRLSYDVPSGLLTLDRRRSGDVGFHPEFASVATASVPLRDGRLALRVFVDGSLVEVFADDGAVTFTCQVFPDAPAVDAVVFADGGTPTVWLTHFSLDGRRAVLVPDQAHGARGG